MKKVLVALLILLGLTVYLKPMAYMTYKGFGRFDPPFSIRLKGNYYDNISTGFYGLRGVTPDGKKTFIPWESIAYVEED
jgi:hypothetical protein